MKQVYNLFFMDSRCNGMRGFNEYQSMEMHLNCLQFSRWYYFHRFSINFSQHFNKFVKCQLNIYLRQMKEGEMHSVFVRLFSFQLSPDIVTMASREKREREKNVWTESTLNNWQWTIMKLCFHIDNSCSCHLNQWRHSWQS